MDVEILYYEAVLPMLEFFIIHQPNLNVLKKRNFDDN